MPILPSLQSHRISPSLDVENKICLGSPSWSQSFGITVSSKNGTLHCNAGRRSKSELPPFFSVFVFQLSVFVSQPHGIACQYTAFDEWISGELKKKLCKKSIREEPALLAVCLMLRCMPHAAVYALCCGVCLMLLCMPPAAVYASCCCVCLMLRCMPYAAV